MTVLKRETDVEILTEKVFIHYITDIFGLESLIDEETSVPADPIEVVEAVAGRMEELHLLRRDEVIKAIRRKKSGRSKHKIRYYQVKDSEYLRLFIFRGNI